MLIKICDPRVYSLPIILIHIILVPFLVEDIYKVYYIESIIFIYLLFIFSFGKSEDLLEKAYYYSSNIFNTNNQKRLFIIFFILSMMYFSLMWLVVGDNSGSRAIIARSNIAFDVIRHGCNVLFPIYYLADSNRKRANGILIFTIIFGGFFSGSKSAALAFIFKALPGLYYWHNIFLKKHIKKLVLITIMVLFLNMIIAEIRSSHSLSSSLLYSFKNRVDTYYMAYNTSRMDEIIQSDNYNWFLYHTHHLSQLLGMGRLYNVPVGSAVTHGLDADTTKGGGGNSVLPVVYDAFGFSYVETFSILILTLILISFLRNKIIKYKNISFMYIFIFLYFYPYLYYMAIDMFFFYFFGGIIFMIKSISFVLKYLK